MTADALYTSLHEAVVELKERRHNQELCSIVADFHRACPPTFMDGGPFACLFRQIITGDNEIKRFLELSRASGLPPLGMSFTEDRFHAENLDKKCLAMLPFWDRHQERMLNIVGVLQNGFALKDITCRNGMSLVKFHRHLLEHQHPGFSRHVSDMSDWAKAVSGAHFDYFPFLALFLTGGILFENFQTEDEEETAFVHERTIPAFEKVERMFGVRPLIVRLFADEEVADPKWWRYPDELYPVAKALLHKPREGDASISHDAGHSGFGGGEGGDNLRHEGQQVSEAIGPGAQHDERDLELRERLLE